MKQVYDLKAGQRNSDFFYECLEKFTDQVIRKADQKLGRFLDEYLKDLPFGTQRGDAVIDVLIFGSLWLEYGIRVKKLKVYKLMILRFLFRMRKKKTWKAGVDILRGRLSRQWLKGRRRDKRALNPEGIKILKVYLKATCEYDEELRRLDALYSFLQKRNLPFVEENLRQIHAFACWYRQNAVNSLAMFTSGVHSFLKDHHEIYKGREDYFFCGKSELEYYLNMTGAAIMNRLLRKEFSDTGNRILLLPTCMASGKKCRAEYINGDLTCRHCSGSCRISAIEREMKAKGMRTVLISHSSSFSKWLKPWAHQKDTGLIGVTCVLNLLTGGYQMKRLGIPSQCLFLEYPGCKKHWRTGKPTDINSGMICKLNCCDKYGSFHDHKMQHAMTV